MTEKASRRTTKDSTKTGDDPSKKSSKKSGKSAEAVCDMLRETHGTLDGANVADALDLAIMAHLVLRMTPGDAVRSYNGFKANFVDWNEVRISSAKDVQDVLKNAFEPLELAILLKDFLHRLFTDEHHLSLEFLREKSISEIRGFFKKSPGFTDSAVLLILHHFKEYPVVPLEAWMLPFMERMKLVNGGSTPLQQQKDLYQTVPDGQVLQAFALFATHARSVCLPEDGKMECPSCVLKKGCPHPKKTTARRKKAK